ncbi:MAG: metabolite traffic protein EboE [Rhodothermales bacterium]
MRIGTKGEHRLTYCTNIHPGETLEDVTDNLTTYTVPLKALVSPSDAMGVGLRLSNQAVAELVGDEAKLERFEQLLLDHDLYVFTLNGFPYGSFHRQRVKDDVYRPDWRDDERLQYTLRLIEVLARLLPDGEEGSISTSPLSYKPWLDLDVERESAFRAGAEHLAAAAFRLFDLRNRTAQLLHIGIEPEPDCLIENTPETIAFFEEWLFRSGAKYLRREYGLSKSQAEDILRTHIGVCYDTCHFAVEFETPEEVLSGFRSAGIRLSKLQISAALRVPLDVRPRDELESALEPFAESTYLHQVVARSADGSLHRYPDLPDALPKLGDEEAEEWRIHYHVPIFVDAFQQLRSTQDDIRPALTGTLQDDFCRHLEIETYTWDVLPEEMKTDIVTSIEREYAWVLENVPGGPA